MIPAAPSASHSGVLLVPDLDLEHWPSMHRYASELARRLPAVGVPSEARSMTGPRFLARYVRYPRALRRYRPRVVHVADHSYAHCLRSFRGVPSVVSVHDLYLVRVLRERPGGLGAVVRNQLLEWVVRWLRSASRWCMLSRFTASEAESLLAMSPERMTVVHPGVDARFFEPVDEGVVDQTRRTWLARTGGVSSDEPRLILHVGSCVGRKNVEAALGAAGALRRRGLDARFVQLGGVFGATHRRAITAGQLDGSVLQQPHVDEAALVAAYRAADVLVMPSLYEGFGLPVIEAQAAGLPVVASNAGGLPEALGGAGLVVEHPDAAALMESVAIALTDTPTRQRLVAAGLAHARTMTWDTTAGAVRRIYEELGA